MGFVAATTTLVAGTVGFHQYEAAHSATASGSWFGSLYHALQLFVLHTPYLPGPTNLALEVGRWSAALIFALTALVALSRVFASEGRLLRLSFTKDHVVVCGLGRLGLPLAIDFRKRGRQVVVIESSPDSERARRAHSAGVTVILGDACKADDLRRAGVARASQVLAVCDDEQTNVAIAAAVGALRAEKKSHRPLECWIFVADSGLRRMLQTTHLFPHTADQFTVNVRGLDLFELTARKLFDDAPLDFELMRETDDTSVHLVVLGFGAVAQQVALQAARIGHFANFERRPLKITVLHQQGDARVSDFLKGYPRFADVCDVSFESIAADAGVIAERLGRFGSGAELVSFALCWDSQGHSVMGETELFERLERDDPLNLSVALRLAESKVLKRRQILVFQTRETGFGALFPIEGRGAALDPGVRVFGMLETMCTLDTLLHERVDVFAKAIHQDYYDNLKAKGKADGAKPALWPWSELAEQYKDFNRRAADHIPIKLRAAGYRAEPLRTDRPRVKVLTDHLELLARMEHQRWSADLFLQNWTVGPRDDAKRVHDNLVPWHRLDAETQDYDRSQVRAIPGALELFGFGIYSAVASSLLS